MPEITLINAMKELRVSINGDIRYAQSLAQEINRGTGGRELALAITNLQQARMWVGEALGELGHTLPEAYRDEA